MWLGSTETGLMELRLSGPGIKVLKEQADQLMAALRKIPGIEDIKQDWNNRVFTARADVDQARARRVGGDIQGCGRFPGLLCRRCDDHRLPPGQCSDSHRRPRRPG